jgi:hypothetical protein
MKIGKKRVEFVIQGIKIPVASIEDIISMKQASGRPVDESDIAMLREAQRIIEKQHEYWFAIHPAARKNCRIHAPFARRKTHVAGGYFSFHYRVPE